MKTTVNFSHFRDSFTKANRTDQFSYDGLYIIFDYLEQYEKESSIEFELDVIAICCDFSEEYCEDIATSYNIDISDCIDESEILETVRNYLYDHTTVIGTLENGNIVYLQF
jgi:hypothetical protein